MKRLTFLKGLLSIPFLERLSFKKTKPPTSKLWPEFTETDDGVSAVRLGDIQLTKAIDPEKLPAFDELGRRYPSARWDRLDGNRIVKSVFKKEGQGHLEVVSALQNWRLDSERQEFAYRVGYIVGAFRARYGSTYLWD
jgi:hypothetical protein